MSSSSSVVSMRYVNGVISITTLQYFWTSISIPSIAFLVDASADSRIYPTCDIWDLLTFHPLGLFLVRQR